MGLPLFVASVESDLTSKAASKAANASPSRSGIRRLSRADSRERRNAIRTASVRIFGHRPPPRPSHSNHDGLLPWVESPEEADINASSPRPQPPSSTDTQEARDTRWQRVVTDSRDRRQFEDQMTSIFGSNWRERGPERVASQLDHGPRDTTDRSGLRSSRSRRAQVVAPVPSRLDSDAQRTRAPRGSPPPNARSTGTNVPPGSYSAVAIMTRASAPRHQSTLLRDANGGRRPPLPRHAFAVDGLGDRDRSLSPEVWDTLLTTLTPDPQPPSAGSSFSLTQQPEWTPPNRSTPDALDVAAADAQCDSCDHSDTSVEEDDENADLRPMRPRRPQLRETHRRISPLNLSGPASAERGALFSWAMPTTAPRSRGENNDDAIARSVPLARLLNGGTEPWTSQGSPGDEASEEDSGSSVLRQANNSGDSSAQTVMLSSEEDWSGMRRIVSSLARREDIPDEWWAEVGLSRTLRRDFPQRP
ncbi:hypothetical protein CP533_0552 [Ophiocordyceps camponoti-saundersi (nom. inval.)]|nr:hypothetical protein CP533_0552 [Ophiocordyceps camponoti-saundersi (nom. inval.)]